jgi:hypothetical protein
VGTFMHADFTLSGITTFLCMFLHVLLMYMQFVFMKHIVIILLNSVYYLSLFPRHCHYIRTPENCRKLLKK